MINGLEKSDPTIVAMQPANKVGLPMAERVEPRVGDQGKHGPITHAPDSVPRKRVQETGPCTECCKNNARRKSSPRCCTILTRIYSMKHFRRSNVRLLQV